MPSQHQKSSTRGGEYESWPEKVVLEKNQRTAFACIKGVRTEAQARAWLGVLNRYGVEGRLRAKAVERIRELAD